VRQNEAPVAKSKTIAVIHGPNLNALGTREPQIYGTMTLAKINSAIRKLGTQLGCRVTAEQYSGEGELVDAIHRAAARRSAIVINPGAYGHYSYALRDALAAVRVPKIEVHLSNTHARERFRRRSVLTPVVSGIVAGFGANSYLLAVRAAAAMLDEIKD
jgi:3-dehydroquinate dehydratase II